MSKDTTFSVHARLKSFKFALHGLLHFFRTEHNAWLHLLATMGVIILAYVVGVSKADAIALIIAVALVWITEMVNTCLEKTMDIITMEYNPKIKIIKDISAGAVLVSAIAALLIGLFVFIPKFFDV